MSANERVVMDLIVNGGNARSLAITAINSAKRGDFDAAALQLEQCNEALQVAHQVQTKMLQAEAKKQAANSNPNGVEDMPVSLIMVHAQDHLMNALTVRDLSSQLVDMYKRLYELENSK